METTFAKPVIATGYYTMSTYGQHYLSGWYFTETSGDTTNTITVTLRADDSTGTILEELTVTGGNSVGEDYAKPIVCQLIHATVSGAGTCQGHVRGR